MKGLINKDGLLEIERAGIMKSQGCPRLDDGYCEDWYPLFGEPDEPDRYGGIVFLRLCDGVQWAFDEFVDERGKM